MKGWVNPSWFGRGPGLVNTIVCLTIGLALSILFGLVTKTVGERTPVWAAHSRVNELTEWCEYHGIESTKTLCANQNKALVPFQEGRYWLWCDVRGSMATQTGKFLPDEYVLSVQAFESIEEAQGRQNPLKTISRVNPRGCSPTKSKEGVIR